LPSPLIPLWREIPVRRKGGVGGRARPGALLGIQYAGP